MFRRTQIRQIVCQLVAIYDPSGGATSCFPLKINTLHQLDVHHRIQSVCCFGELGSSMVQNFGPVPNQTCGKPYQTRCSEDDFKLKGT